MRSAGASRSLAAIRWCFATLRATGMRMAG
nr:MAG TPA: hypothetical protein [Caudoviricetes sp.]